MKFLFLLTLLMGCESKLDRTISKNQRGIEELNAIIKDNNSKLEALNKELESMDSASKGSR